MSDSGPKESDTAPKLSEPTKTATPKKKGWSNPALRAMGIPRIALPSRNWMIFIGVCSAVGGGIAYDKYQQSCIREKWMAHVEAMGQVPYTSEKLPRKLTIYIAPPPNDFLDVSLRLFRRYIKPILNSSAIDYDLYSAQRQGDIRSAVAKKIRELRAAKLQEEKENQLKLEAEIYNKSWTKFLKEDVPGWFKWGKKPVEDEEKLVPRSELYKASDVLGLYQLVDPIEPQSEDQIDMDLAGGVVCIGRGAFKEYLTGVHEGLLGPLEKPQELIEEELKIEAEKQQKKEDDEKNGIKSSEEDDDDEEESEGGLTKKKEPVVKPFIRPEQYPEAKLAPELDLTKRVTDDKNVPVFFEQPIYVFPVPNLLGFLTIPRKIYRFYTKRELAEDFGHRTTAIVENKTRPFEYKDSLSAKEEELDWPKKWVETGKSKGSEWVQDLVVDDRIISRMRVYDNSDKN